MQRKSCKIEFDAKFFDDAEGTRKRIRRMMKALEEDRKWEVDEKCIFDAGGYDGLVVVRNIFFTCWCKHHMREFYGYVDIGCKVDGKVLGLSKFVRIVRKFASKPALQEELTKEVVDYLMAKLPNVKGVVVRVRAKHNCICGRGVRAENAEFVTVLKRGEIDESLVLKLMDGG